MSSQESGGPPLKSVGLATQGLDSSDTVRRCRGQCVCVVDVCMGYECGGMYV